MPRANGAALTLALGCASDPSPDPSGSAAVSDEAIEQMADILSHAVGFGPTSRWLGRCGVVIPGLRENQDLRLRKLTGQSGTGVGNV
jgi:hypothetical protein